MPASQPASQAADTTSGTVLENRHLFARRAMGYRPMEADRAIEQLGGKVAETPLPELLKEALAVLSK